MGHRAGGCFDAATIKLLSTVLEEAWEALPTSRKQTVLKSELAERLLGAAEMGERDPERLRAIALMRPMDTTAAGRAAALLRSSLARNA